MDNRKTAAADIKLDQRGRVVEATNGDLESDPNVLIVEESHEFAARGAEQTNGQKNS